MRDVAYGIRRFSELQEDLGISANVLSDRLATLVSEGVLTTRAYQERPERHEYLLSEKGQELLPVLIALMRWGDRWTWGAGGGAPVRVLHEQCGTEVTVEVRCSHCERELSADELLALPGDAVPAPPREGEPGYLSGRQLYADPAGIPVGRLEADAAR